MRPAVHAVGAEGAKVVVIDSLHDDPMRLVDEAEKLSPFASEADTYYPGVRRLLHSADLTLNTIVDQLLERLAPLIGETFGMRSFMPVETSLCLVTRSPHELAPAQRLPHYDRTDPGFLAVLLYLGEAEQGGTNFFRHRATGFERIGPDRVRAYEMARQREDAALGEPPPRYLVGSDERFERIAGFDAAFNRALVYQGSVLHSGAIPEGFEFSADPRRGRLTLNIFVQGL